MRLIPLIFLACIFSVSVSAQTIESVVVRNANFEVVKALRPEELSEFERQWNTKTAIEKEENISTSKCGAMHFKLDVSGGNSGGRWLYCPDGYTHVLSVKSNITIYKMSDPESFNKLIGIAE